MFKAVDWIAQLLIERIATTEAMELDDLAIPERGNMGFGSSDLSPKRSITAEEEGIKIGFLLADTSDNKFFTATDISWHPRLMRAGEMLSSAHVNAAPTRTMNNSFLDKIKVGGKEDETWQERGHELVRLRERGKEMQNDWEEKDGLL